MNAENILDNSGKQIELFLFIVDDWNEQAEI